MNIRNLHKMIQNRDTAVYLNFKDFINAYAKNPSEYALFNIYLFRLDCLQNAIARKDWPFYEEKNYYTKNGKVDFKNAAVQKYAYENGMLYIGNTLFKEKLHPIFLSFKVCHNGHDSIVTGWSIKTEDDVMFTCGGFKKIKTLSKNEMMQTIHFASDEMKKNIFEMQKRTRDFIGA